MIVFLRNIPADTSRQDIIDFLMPVVKGGLFRTRGKIVSIDILAIQDNNSRLTEYHGLAHIVPDEVGQRIIRKLNRQHFKGKRILLREYVVRSWQNDRRDPSRTPPPGTVDRRKGPLRRSNVQIQKLKSIKPDPE